jgi:hypothetical protein
MAPKKKKKKKRKWGRFIPYTTSFSLCYLEQDLEVKIHVPMN